jgi:hypothetical protein
VEAAPTNPQFTAVGGTAYPGHLGHFTIFETRRKFYGVKSGDPDG